MSRPSGEALWLAMMRHIAASGRTSRLVERTGGRGAVNLGRVSGQWWRPGTW